MRLYRACTSCQREAMRVPEVASFFPWATERLQLFLRPTVQLEVGVFPLKKIERPRDRCESFDKPPVHVTGSPERAKFFE